MIACVIKVKSEIGNTLAARENAVTRGARYRGSVLDVEISQYYNY
jgi:hypothetical protein